MTFQEEYIQITDKLAELKTQQIKLQSELHIAYEYKESLINKLHAADKQISDKQNEYYKHLNTVQTEISRLKIAMDLEVSRVNIV